MTRKRKQISVLIRHFVRQLLDSELVPRNADARVTMIQILALVATPGLFIMCLLMRKHARLAPLPAAQAHLASLDERCLFIYFSMIVVGLVAVLEWDTLFPDRRDYLILTSLPVGDRTLFTAKAASLCIFVLLFCVFVNGIPALLYPLFAGRGLLHALRFVLSHSLSVLAADAFVFFACAALHGFLLNLLPHRFSGGASRAFQLLLLVFLLSIFLLMPFVSFETLSRHPVFLACFAPAWFLGLYETLLVGRTPDFLPLAVHSVSALGLAAAGFVLSYIVAYRRRLRMTLDSRQGTTTRDSCFIAGLSHHLALSNPKEAAAFHFVVKTLVRSQTQRTCFGAYLGVGLAFAAMGLITLFSRHGIAAMHELRPELLSIPLVLTFFMLVGLRVSFSIPAGLGANWIFRLTDGNRLAHCISGVRKAMLFIAVVPVVLPLLPVYASLWGWHRALVHVSYCATLAMLLAELLLCRLEKIPFTCTYAPGKANLKLWWWAYLFGFTNYAYTMTELEMKLFRDPRYFVLFFALCLALLAGAVRARTRSIAHLPQFRYEAEPVPSPEPLVLS
jgi:hypothetical protein